MKKSPFSTPPRNRGGRSGFGWKSGSSPGRGYGRLINDEYCSPNRSLVLSQSQSFGDDFIPFKSCTPPLSDLKSGRNWQIPKAVGQRQDTGRGNLRHSVSPGYNSCRDNRHRDNHQQAPFYKDGANSFHGQCKNFHRGNSPGSINISKYLNLQSFLEDPWAELTQKFSNNENCDDSLNATLALDFSFTSSTLDVVCEEGIDNHFIESEASEVLANQE